MKFRAHDGREFPCELEGPISMPLELGVEMHLSFEDPDGHLRARLEEFGGLSGEIVGGPLDGERVYYDPPDPLD